MVRYADSACLIESAGKFRLIATPGKISAPLLGLVRSDSKAIKDQSIRGIQSVGPRRGLMKKSR